MAHDHSELRRRSRREADHKAERFASGGTARDDEAQDRKMIATAIGEHEAHDHPGRPKTKLKLKDGGRAEGDEAKPRLDRGPRRKLATGGRAKGKSTHVNVIVAPGAGHPAMPMGGMGMPPAPAAAAPAPMAPRAPMPRPPMSAPMAPPPGGPMGGPGMMPRARGGRTVHLDAGSGGGEGRLEKAKAARKAPAGENSPETEDVEGMRLKKGGRC